MLPPHLSKLDPTVYDNTVKQKLWICIFQTMENRGKLKCHLPVCVKNYGNLFPPQDKKIKKVIVNHKSDFVWVWVYISKFWHCFMQFSVYFTILNVYFSILILFFAILSLYLKIQTLFFTILLLRKEQRKRADPYARLYLTDVVKNRQGSTRKADIAEARWESNPETGVGQTTANVIQRARQMGNPQANNSPGKVQT